MISAPSILKISRLLKTQSRVVLALLALVLLVHGALAAREVDETDLAVVGVAGVLQRELKDRVRARGLVVLTVAVYILINTGDPHAVALVD